MGDDHDPHRTAGRWPRLVPGSGGAPGSPGPGGTLDLPDEDVVAPSPPNAIAPGDRIGRFVVGEQLGAGGMGVVYAARDVDLDRAVAIKLVRADRNWASVRARLLREARAMAQLDHPNIVRIHELGEHAGAVYIAMERIDGEPLDAWLAHPRPWRDVVSVFLQAADGLAAVHRAGMVHRDIKPSNILVDRAGRARLADFGLVREETSDVRLTVTGARLGTPGYIAPEQERDGAVDARADQYSFAVALDRALAEASTPAPETLRRIVARGRAVDPAARYASVEDLATAIERAVQPRRGRLAAALIGAATVAIGVVAAVLLAGRGGPTATEGLGLAAQPVDAGADPTLTPVAATPFDAGGEPVAIVDVGAPTPVADPARPPADPARPPPPNPAAAAAAAAAPSDRRSTGATAPARGPGPGVREVSIVEGVPVVEPTSTPRALPPAVASPPPKLVARLTDPARLTAARRAIRDLGYRGFDLAALDGDRAGTEARLAAARAERVAAGDPEDAGLPRSAVELGMAARRRGDCATAIERFERAAIEFKAYDVARHHLLAPALWRGRAGFGIALCRLARGDLAGARAAMAVADLSWLSPVEAGELAELQLANAIIYFEQGSASAGRVAWMLASVVTAEHGALAATARTWAAAVGVEIR